MILDNAVELSLYTWLWGRILRIIEKGHVRYYRSWEIGEMLMQARFQQVELCHLKNEFMNHGKLFASLQVWSGQKPRDDQSEKRPTHISREVSDAKADQTGGRILGLAPSRHSVLL